ncbi:CgeB family protein [Acidisoma cladoniae]|uniref:CgeB family protein n=1 Tax=Acidisoma cladoniae TaxID=3040935 RepID=UPI002551BF24|nr:glycosyltransferase [Acidisoma sp. PAMC 29798]
MKIVVLGLSLSSSWGNGHATTFRALLRVLGARHDVLFLERDQPWYAANRDLPHPDFCRLAFYEDVAGLARFRSEIEAADAVILGSYVTEGAVLAPMIRDWVNTVFCFYDIDTPVTLSKLQHGDIDYVSHDTIALFDVYFSFTGGPTLRRLETEFGARRATPLYCSVDDSRYRPMVVETNWDLGYLGTYSPDRQPALERLLLEPARRMPSRRFVVAGPMYPADIDWPENVERIDHIAPDDHAAFYNAQSWTLNITRADMIASGYSPSVRLFEATACGTAVMSDVWLGLDTIFKPDHEIMLVETSADVVVALAAAAQDRAQLAEAGRARCLAMHTSKHRAAELEAAIASFKLSPSAAGRAGALS